MLPDWDIALIPHPAYFTHRLGSLAFEILSDTPLLETELYALSTYTGERVRVEAKTEVSTEGKRYGATVIKPKRNHIYFVLFKR
ncbi:MAG: hypothetical protein DHS20C05_02610 [Hyphococcus sp.]|nr:MAG: hypothetical protein DHS20C05_02610 [Marinicaulis sp.]